MATWPHLIRPRAHARMLANAWTRASTNAHALTRTCACEKKKDLRGDVVGIVQFVPINRPLFLPVLPYAGGGEGKRARERETERERIEKKKVRKCDMTGPKHQASAPKKHPVHTSGSKASSKHTISVAQATPCTRKWKQRMKQAHHHILPHQTTRTHSNTQGGPCPASFTHVKERGILYCARLSQMFR
jgi:hypothetical protein